MPGDAENARKEIAGLENAAQNRIGGNCRPGKCGTKSHWWKMQDWKMRHKTARVEIAGKIEIIYF